MKDTSTSPIIERARAMGRRLGFTPETLSYDALASLLRTLGAGVIVTSLSLFLFRGWTSGNDVERYLLLLAHTGLLTVAGFASSRLLRENKGARLFLILALIAVVANFAVLGGLLYSQWPWDGALAVYPDFARWQAGTGANLLIISAFAVPVLALVSWIGFRALGRRSAATLSAWYLVGNAALLIPFRDSIAIGILVVGLGFAVLWRLIRLGRVDPTVRTSEGRIARGILMLPLALLVARGAWLYAADEAMLTMVSAMAFIVLRQTALELHAGRRLRLAIERMSVVPAALTALGATLLSANLDWMVAVMYIPVFVLTLAALLVEISIRAANRGAYQRWAVLVVCAGLLINTMLFSGLGTAAVCVVAGVIVLVYGYSVQQQLMVGAGLVTALSGLLVQIRLLTAWFDLGAWQTLAAFGILAIVTASILERHGLALRSRTAQWFKRFRGWKY